ncbi:GNAT family N-acetyltransferase [Pediococcus siamensis]|uniref:GNAT family N-acetyltransferase n=1 Tax=Pediococcus siamensis TaxID=381829 RepID=UPI0039A3032C
MWKIKKLNDLTSLEFYQITKLLIDTFVVEQTRIYHELDANDLIADHVYTEDETTHEVLAYARIFEEADHLTFGRVVTAEQVRGTGLGRKLIEQVLRTCQEKWPDKPIVIEAQIQVADFYQKFGFQKISATFLFNGTPHVKMYYQHHTAQVINA